MWHAILTVLQQSWYLLTRQALIVAPHVLAASLILLVGIAAGVAISMGVQYLLAGAHLERYAARYGVSSWLENVAAPAVLAARIVKWIIIFIAAGLAVDSLAPRVAEALAVRVLDYAPDFVVGVFILTVGAIASRFLSQSVLIAAVNREMRWPHLAAYVTRFAVLAITVAAALEQLDIARRTVLTAFGILFGGATLAAALAIGLGSQELVRRWLAEKSSGASETESYKIRHW
jgi:hypothetical protein